MRSIPVTVEDVFGIQEEIASKIVGALEVQLGDAGRPEVTERPIEDSVAYDCYLRARQEMYGWTPDALGRALKLVDDALGIVGDSPLLLATKAQICWNTVNTSQVSPEEGLGQASDLVERALALDPDFPLAVFVRGLVAGLRGRPELALPDLYRAHESWPNDANVLAELCRFSNTAGLRNHRTHVDRLVRIDPLTPVTPLVVSTYSILNGLRQDAARAARKAIEMAPQNSVLHLGAAWQIAEAGFNEEASQILARIESELQGALRSWALFLKNALDGNVDEALRHATPETEEAMSWNEFSARWVAHGYLLLGRKEDALRFLRLAIDRGFLNYPSLTEHDAFLERLHDDPAFRQMMEEVKPRWEALVEWEQSTQGS